MFEIPSFEEIEKELLSSEEEVEEVRRAQMSSWGGKSLIWGSVIIFLTLLVSYLTDFFPYGLFIGAVLLVFVISGLYSSCKSEVSAVYKEKIIGKLTRMMLKDGEYLPNSGITENIFCGSGLFVTPDRYHAEDGIRGHVGNTAVNFSEVHAEEQIVTYDSKGRRHEHWNTIFRGFLFVADFNKDFSGRTVVCRNSWFKWGGNRVKLENPDFEKRFDVYSSDQVEARYILSPALMERIVTLDEKYDNRLLLSFYQSSLIVALEDSSDHFEVSFCSRKSNINSLRREYDTIYDLLSIVDDLNLNLRIWTKE